MISLRRALKIYSLSCIWLSIFCYTFENKS